MKKSTGRKKKAADAASASAQALQEGKRKTAVRKAGSAKKTVDKRIRQYRHLRTLLRAAIRILNALDHKTIYRN